MGRKRARPSGRVATQPQAAAAPGAPLQASGRPQDPARPPGRDSVWLLVCLLLVAGVHLGWVVQPDLRYTLTAPPFFLDAPFFNRMAALPGGLLQYGAAALAQANFHAPLGTWVFLLLLGGIVVLARTVLATGAGVGATLGAAALGLLLTALTGRYDHAADSTLLNLLAMFLAARLWLVVPANPAAAPLIAAALGVTGLYFACGPLPSLGLALWLAGAEGIDRRRPWMALGCGLTGLPALLWTADRPDIAILDLTATWGTGLSFGLHGTALLWLPAWMWLQRLATRVPLRFPRAAPAGLTWAAALVAALCLCWTTLDTQRRAQARVEQAVQHEDWAAALAAFHGIQDWTPTLRLHLLRVLHHTGRLPHDLFRYPQQRGLDPLPGYAAGLEMAFAEAQTLLELGQVNLAEHMAHESLELRGPQPETLRLLADVNVLKGRPEAARVFLRKLRRVPFWNAEAALELQRLQEDSPGLQSPRLACIRAVLPDTDEPDLRLPTDLLLRQLIKSCPTNQMAQEYLVVYRLLNLQLEDLATDLQRLSSFRGQPLPLPCEEALALYLDRNRDRAALPPLPPISSTTLARFRRFSELARSHTERPAAARAALQAEFGDSFWLYALAGETAPKVKTHARR